MIETVSEIARRAGALQVESHRRGRPGDIREKAPHDFVTAVDRACEALIHDALRDAFPDVPVLAEEGTGTASGREGRFWCVDPLDGTNNFVHGVPMFCVSIGLVEQGAPRLGVVYDAVHGELFTGGEGYPALLNGAPVATSGKAELHGGFLATGFPYREFDRLETYIASFRRVVRRAGGVRRCGSAALDICYTACGRFDGFWELGLAPWDMAAGAAILRAAGGVVTDPSGGAGFLFGGDIVAGATPSLHAELRAAITGP
jgi:myo-inositol-1(or 4)-monophosphatase